MDTQQNRGLLSKGSERRNKALDVRDIQDRKASSVATASVYNISLDPIVGRQVDKADVLRVVVGLPSRGS